MRYTLESLALVVIVAGFLLFNTTDTAVFGALLVAGGAYAMILPQFVRPQGPTTH